MTQDDAAKSAPTLGSLLSPEKEAALNAALDSILKEINGGKCEVCGEPAGGMGAGRLYCSLHFWEKIDDPTSHNVTDAR